MHGIVCDRYGEPDLLRFGALAPPVNGPGQIRIRVRAAGVNFPDTLIIKGLYQLKPPMPFAPGFEAAGEVIELGEGVDGYRLGDPVMGLTACGYGAYAEEAVLNAAETVPIPRGMGFVEAAGFYTAYGTAYHALVQRGQLQAGETLAVLGASGSVGLAAVELGAALGARVIAIGRSLEKLKVANSKGADVLLSYEAEDFSAELKMVTGGRGLDVVVDTLGGAPFDIISRVMSFGGRLLTLGFTTGVIPKLPVNLPLLKGYALVGVYWGAFVSREPHRNAANFEAMADMIRAGRLKPAVSATYPLADAARALNDLLGRRSWGKLVLEVA